MTEPEEKEASSRTWYPNPDFTDWWKKLCDRLIESRQFVSYNAIYRALGLTSTVVNRYRNTKDSPKDFEYEWIAARLDIDIPEYLTINAPHISRRRFSDEIKAAQQEWLETTGMEFKLKPLEGHTRYRRKSGSFNPETMTLDEWEEQLVRMPADQRLELAERVTFSLEAPHQKALLRFILELAD